MAKRGERQPYRVSWTYPNGIKGTKAFVQASSSGYFGGDLLERGADIKVEFVHADGTRLTIAEREATEQAKASFSERVGA